MKKRAIFPLLLTVLIPSCEKTDFIPLIGYEDVTLENLTGFDGCGFLFETGNKSYLEPVNLGEFVTNPVAGEEYRLKYRIETNRASICMVGPIITILELKKETTF